MRIARSIAAVAALSLVVASPALAEDTVDTTATAVADGPVSSYIVQFTPGSDRSAEVSKAKGLGMKVTYEYTTVLNGMAVVANKGQLTALQKNPNVRLIEADGVVTTSETQSPATWGLDRTDQRDLPLSNSYASSTTAANVTAYIIDTGINSGHVDFGGRVKTGFTSITDGLGTEDCDGHGTHVAGTVGSLTYGMAKGVSLVPVRVLDCSGSGTWTGVIAGIDWVAANATKPAVANMSLGGGASSAVDTAVNNLVASGVTAVVAAGNSNVDACTSSPARAASAITVGATQSNDARASYSNFGTCLDVFAPGTNITSTWSTSTTATSTISGTSMASPHVAGAAALYLATDPSASPSAVTSALTSSATANKVTSAGTGSPNRLLYVGASTPPVAPIITGFTPATGYAGSTVTVSGTNLAGATAKVNTTTATVTASSATSLTLTVPAGATTGPISVTTSGGTATSLTNYTVQVATVPGAPTIGTATPGTNRNATVRWTQGSNGGRALTGQTIRVFQGATSTTVWRTVNVSATATSANVGSLTRGVVYRFTVSATNGVGAGPQSGYSNTITAR